MSTAILSRARGKVSPLQGITTEVLHVSPAMAEQLLANNTQNRRIKSRKVSQMARDMVRGSWEFNGETIKIAVDGHVLDGQHRLSAAKESGITVPFLVVRGLPARAQETIDIGTKRSVSDSLSMRGEKNSALLAATARRIMLWEVGNRTGNGGEFSPSDSEVREFIDNHSLVRVATSIADSGRRKINLPPSVLGLSLYLCLRLDPEAADEFFVTQLIDGIGLRAGDPALALRNMISRPMDRDGRLPATSVLAYTLRAWNAYRGGERLTRLQSPKGTGWNASNIPTPL